MVERWGEPSTWAGFSPDASPERLAWGARYLRMAGSPKTFQDTILALSEIDIRPGAPHPARPGARAVTNATTKRSPSRTLATSYEHIPGATSYALEGRAHYLADDDTARLVDVTVEFLTGTRPSDDIDRVLATVMFTDIVASTARAASQGDKHWRELLDDHDRLVHDAVRRFRGRVIKTTGDGALATFDGPARAVRAGESITTGVHLLGLEARVGVHTGELEMRRRRRGRHRGPHRSPHRRPRGTGAGSGLTDRRRSRRRIATRIRRCRRTRSQRSSRHLATLHARRRIHQADVTRSGHQPTELRQLWPSG